MARTRISARKIARKKPVYGTARAWNQKVRQQGTGGKGRGGMKSLPGKTIDTPGGGSMNTLRPRKRRFRPGSKKTDYYIYTYILTNI